jgi:myosin tail region-interacting protein MTI1
MFQDGDARALVWAAMSDAGLDANTSFGTLILEQNGPSVLRRMDEPRPGDIVVLSDVKLKGKKGLHSYTQAAGSVEIPVFAICSEFETKKTKVKVWQVEQGVSGWRRRRNTPLDC